MNKLSFSDAKEIISDIDHAKGRIKEVAARHPWLVQLCQEAAAKQLGAQFSVYRAVSLLGKLNPDTIASTSLDWKVCWGILEQTPGMIFHGDKTLMPKPTLLHYRISPKNVVLWIPFAMQFVRQAIGKRANHGVEDRYGTRIKIQTVLDAMVENDEKEIIADLHGLRPKILSFGEQYSSQLELWSFLQFMKGNAE